MKETKRFFYYILSLLIFFFLLSGCTQTITQSANFADSGIKYTDAMNSLLEVTADTVIDDDNAMLLYQQRLVSMEDKKEEQKKLEGYLKERDKALEPLLKTLGTFQSQNQTLKSYFVNLKGLAETDAPERIEESVKGLSASINQANTTILESKQVVFTEAEKNAIGRLSGLVAKGVKAAKLQAALKRDASIIGEQLLLHEKLLDRLSKMLRQSAAEANIILKKEEVIRPYKKKEISNVTEWKATRKRLLKTSFYDQSLDTAKRAAGEMQMIWQGILEGKQDIASMQLLIADINDFAAAMNQLKEAHKEKEKSNE